ncbi:hypothetical protein, partial [Agarivorans gilvus]
AGSDDVAGFIQQQAQQDELGHRTWLANGGDGSIEEWRAQGRPSELMASVLAKVDIATRVDYSKGFERDLLNFKSGYVLIDGPLDNDLVLVSYHADTPLGEGRSAKWWTTTDQANAMSTIDDVHQGLALPHDWGVRDTVSVIKIGVVS